MAQFSRLVFELLTRLFRFGFFVSEVGSSIAYSCLSSRGLGIILLYQVECANEITFKHSLIVIISAFLCKQ